MLLGLPASLGAALMFGVGAVLLAVGVRQVPPLRSVQPRLILRVLRQPAILAALTTNLTGFALHLVALRSLPLFLAQAGIASSLAVTALLTVRVFGTRLTKRDWLAVLAVCLGLALLAASAGQAGEDRKAGHSSVALFGVLIFIAVAGFGASRVAGPLGAALVGLVAGLGFAVVSIAARLIPSLAPAAVVQDPAAYALVASGALAFVLYSLALQSGSVMTATTPMIVAQTVTPATVGVLLLGDAVRPGWGLGAVLGLLLAGAGATALARFEGVRV